MAIEILGVKAVAGHVVHGSLGLDGVHVPIILAAGAFSESAFRCVAPATALSGV